MPMSVTVLFSEVTQCNLLMKVFYSIVWSSVDTNRYYHIAKHKEPARLNNSNGAMNMGVGVRPLAEQGPTKVVSPCKLNVTFCIYINIIIVTVIITRPLGS